jgi:hypothetical protein
MCCFRTKPEHASMRQSLRAACATHPVANENPSHPSPCRPARRPVRWRDVSVLVAIAPTLAAITLFASYYFGGH